LQTDKKDYGRGDTIMVNSAFRIVGGLRESFHPDVWTVAWEDYDKILRLKYRMQLGTQRGPLTRKLAEEKKAIRKASFYWSRDPDLPYRIWAMVIPEDGGPPIIPLNVEDAKSKMFDVVRKFEIPAASLGEGSHNIMETAEVSWSRRSFIEKGSVSGKSKPVMVTIE
jgi:hypothetical protein